MGACERGGNKRKRGAGLEEQRPASRRSGFANDRGRHQGPWIVANTPAASWIFAGTGLEPGSPFARAGIEADSTTPKSPRGTQVVARIPNVFGKGRDAEMTYYELPTGAKVFAAGAFTLAGAASIEDVGRILGNVWSRLGEDGAVTVPPRG